MYNDFGSSHRTPLNALNTFLNTSGSKEYSCHCRVRIKNGQHRRKCDVKKYQPLERQLSGLDMYASNFLL